MHRLKSFALFVSAFLATASPCLAAVEVVFLHPEAYSDASLYNGYGAKGQEPALRGIREHLQRLGERYLKPGDTLKIEVLDIDLAGRFEWWRPYAYDVRILRDITWPRMKLRYVLDENGRRVACPEEFVSDQAYLMNAAMRSSMDPLKYEKSMLDDWFRARIARKGGCST
ncbi:MAG: DUF3016 domain-containing protein [Alphaproteobacteria bacterium]|nr:DUF3016 domain-containing protein [Alphaproteobacteria bacterium]